MTTKKKTSGEELKYLKPSKRMIDLSKMLEERERLYGNEHTPLEVKLDMPSFTLQKYKL